MNNGLGFKYYDYVRLCYGIGLSLGDEIMKDYFEYLTELRDGGTMNMMWAPTMLQVDFDLDKKEAREVFSKWCKSLKGN